MIPSGYAEDKVYSAVPTDGSGDLSFTRSSNGTRINSAGLVEVVPWNLMSYSEQFDNAFWNKATSGSATFVVTANQTIAPNGTNTADLVSITRSATSELAAIYTSIGQGIGTFKNTIWLKAKDNSNVGKTIDLWSWESATRGYTKVTLTADWVRYEQDTTVFTGSASELFDFGLLPITYSTSTTLAVEFYAWGGQSNIGSTAKPYFPTTDRLNVPRLTYQNGGGGCPSLLLEKQSTNLLTYSQDFTQASWNKTNQGVGSVAVVTANYAISPDGTQNATRFVCNLNGGTSTNDRSWMLANFTAQSTSTLSIWIKLNSAGTKTFVFSDSGGNIKTISGTEWQRIDTTFGGGSGEFRIGLIGGLGTSDTLDCCIWGAQVEASSYPTSLINTTSASATRVADACSKTGISSLIGQTEGTLFAEIDYTLNTESAGIIGIDAGSTTFAYIFVGSSNTLYFNIYNSASEQASLSFSLPSSGKYKIAGAYKVNDFVLYVNGVQRATDTSGTVPACSILSIDSTTYGLPPNSKHSQLVLFKTRLTNAELASLTTL
jgi:hypothetical protein